MDRDSTHEISFMDLTLFVLQKWKVVLASICMFCIVFATIALLINKQESNKTFEQKVDDLSSNISKEDQESIRNSAKLLSQYLTIYDNQKKYNEESIVQRMDSFNVLTKTLTYSIDNDFQIVYPVVSENNNIVAITKAYLAILNTDTIYSGISSVFGDDLLPLYYRELVSVDFTNWDEGIFSIKITCSDQDTLDVLCERIKSAIDDCLPVVTEKYGTHEVKLIEDTLLTTYSQEFCQKQQDNIVKLSDLTANIDTIKEKYNGDKYLYLMALATNDVSTLVSVPKYTIIGAFVGLLLTVIFFCFKYFLSSNIMSNLEFHDTFSIPVIGNVMTRNEDKLPIDKLIYKLRVKKWDVSIDEALVYVKNNYSSLYGDEKGKLSFIFNNFDGEENELIEGINDKLSIVEPTFVMEKFDTIYDVNDIVKDSAVVLVEKFGKTNKSKLAKKIDILKKANIKIVGVIIIC